MTWNEANKRIALGLLAVACSLPALGTPLTTQQHCKAGRPESLLLTGTVAAGGLKGQFSRTIELGSGRFVETRDYGIIRTASGFDGRTAWSQDVSGAAHDLNSEFAQRLARSQAWLAAQRQLSTESGFTAISGCSFSGDPQASGVTAVAEGDKHFNVHTVTPSGGAPVQLWYDSATGLLSRVVLQYTENLLIRHYDDWRDIGSGLRVAFKQAEEDVEDESTTTFLVQAARLQRRHGSDPFARPAPPNDVRFLEGERASTVSYEDDHRTRIYIPVYLNGRGPFTFELDSGGHFILAPQTLSVLGLTPQGELSATGAGSEIRKAGYVRLDTVRVGSAEWIHQAAMVLPLTEQSNDRGGKPPRAGILGLELFERFRVSIDREHTTVKLEPPAGPALPTPWVAVPIAFDEDAPLVAGSFGGASGQLMIDTGNAGSTIIEQYWAEQQGLARLFGSAQPIGGGSVRLAVATIGLGDTTFRNEVVSYYGAQPRGSEHTRSVAAILGEPLMSRFDMVLDYAHDALWLRPLADRPAIPFNRSGLVVAKAADGSFKVSEVIAGSPAAQEGIQSGDVIDTLDGQPAKSLSKSDFTALLQQPVGTAMHIELRNGGMRPRPQATIRLRDVLPNMDTASRGAQ